MKPWSWVWNATLRTVRGVHPALAAPDDAWAEARLPPPELRLYLGMDARERDHAVRVAKGLSARHPDAPAELVRAALLHDVGKSRRSYRVHERIVVHLVGGGSAPPEPRLRGLAGARQVARHHAAYGAAMIRDAGGSTRVAELVARHERPGDDPDARRLHDADRRT